MKILVTAGSTAVMIDKVRMISNIFSGRTGAAIAGYFAGRGNEVTLVASGSHLPAAKLFDRIKVVRYQTFDDLANVMQEEITGGNYDVIIHSAAVSDFRVGHIYGIDPAGNRTAVGGDGKISSRCGSLELRLVPTPKLVDLIRRPWGFTGTLVKFKLEVGVSPERLIAIAQASRKESEADLIVANCLEWSRWLACIIGRDGRAEFVARNDLPSRLYEAISALRRKEEKEEWTGPGFARTAGD